MEIQSGNRTWLGTYAWTPLGVAARINPQTGMLMTPFIYQIDIRPDLLAKDKLYNFRARNANTGKEFRLVSRQAITGATIRQAWEVDAKGRPIFFSIIPSRMPQT